MLTPLDIHNKEFSKGFMGFNEDDVNEFLDQIIKDYEMTIREKNELQERYNNIKLESEDILRKAESKLIAENKEKKVEEKDIGKQI